MKEAGGTPRALRRLLGAAVVVPVLLSGALAWQGRTLAIQDGELTVDRSARIVADHLGALLQVHAFALNRVATRLEADEPDLAADPERLRRLLVQYVSESPKLKALSVIGQDGRLIASSTTPSDPDVSFADRDHFLAVRNGLTGFHIGRPVTDRVTGAPILPFVRRAERRDGSFQAAVLSAVPLDQLAEFFRTLGGQQGQSVTVARSDGTVLLRTPATITGVEVMGTSSGFMRTLARSREGGLYRTVSELDRVERLHVVRPVGGHDAYVSVGIETEAIFANWLRVTGPLVGLTLLSGLALAATAWIALRRALGERAAYTELQAEVRRREALEHALRQSQKLEAIGQLTGGIAHDFNNHLQVIGANLQLLRMRALGAEAMLFVGNALAGVDRAATLAARLLAFARQQPLEPKVVNLGRVIQGMTDLLRRTLGEAIEIETVIAGGLWNTNVDVGQIENAILNLAVNARDAMKGRGKLTIEAGNAVLDDSYAAQHSEVTAGQYVMVAVSDDGPGMPPKVLERAFEPFFTTKRPGEGTGLGLSMIHGFVKQSGGHVKIYSELGQGTTVKIYMPRIRAPEHEDRFRAAEVRGGSETVLVVEDDTDVRAATVALVRSLGYRTIEAKDAESALTVLESGAKVELLFTDVVMPGDIDTRDFARRALEIDPTLRVLFTSGYTANAIVHHGRLDEGVALLGKPFSREALAGKIRLVLDGARHGDRPPEGPAKRRILVVEDDALVRLSTVEMVRDLGHEAFEAADAAEALDILRRETVDVLLSDVGLPGMSGSDLVDEARRYQPGIAVVMATGYAGFSLPGTATLPKPYTKDGLARALADALAQTRAATA